ncbi:3-oxoacyl-[acyl-carrier-protein] synthase III C-terminal domain-containing protein [Paenibacillus sp.]|jgi:3-oxoacyl-[acyl-carrier-protein] synthase III|uniref:3-oxoacyl-[acyl-carrier-protein] synthase III C-terminal domain-containing protein n=1 Tax=Paenibacillus sp. TaxID=58172 RepID=UPI00282A28C9|nr:3-oxoacyl-[acyl-carrier-protein] synthase III C-terminal domain-containing protein [Paenibacillus sp.]MDR0267466.1 hypothetical protein [Paenibacillus sp.]
MIGLQALQTYVPAQLVPLTELSNLLKITEVQVNQLRDEFRLDRIAVEPDLLVHEMMHQTAVQLIEQNGISPKDIGLILFTHSIPQFTPFLFDPFARLRKKYGLDNLQAYSIGQLNCASLDMLFLMAWQYLRQRNDGRGVLLLFGDKMFFQTFRYLKDSTVMGDAAATAYLSPNAAGSWILGSTVQVDATIFEGVKASPEDFMWFQRTLTLGLVKTIRTTLQKCNLNISQISLIFPSNINEKTWLKVSGLLKIPPETFYYPTMKYVGHAHNVDCLLNLEAAVDEKRLKKGDYFATLTVGMGNTFGCTIFQY